MIEDGYQLSENYIDYDIMPGNRLNTRLHGGRLRLVNDMRTFDYSHYEPMAKPETNLDVRTGRRSRRTGRIMPLMNPAMKKSSPDS